MFHLADVRRNPGPAVLAGPDLAGDHLVPRLPVLAARERQPVHDLRQASLSQLGDLQFGEYYEPFTGEPLGSARQSWTAAVALDWLAPEPEAARSDRLRWQGPRPPLPEPGERAQTP